MTSNTKCLELVLPEPERMLKYKNFAVAFSYPDDAFFTVYPQVSSAKEELWREYDRLFRTNEIWLYGCEYTAENEFQRTQSLADISGFYRAFGLETDKDRPDLLSCQLEFMYYLIYKELYAAGKDGSLKAKEKQSVCFEAQKKFFQEYLYPAVEKIAEKIISQSQNNFYTETAKELLQFLKREQNLFLEQ